MDINSIKALRHTVLQAARDLRKAQRTGTAAETDAAQRALDELTNDLNSALLAAAQDLYTPRSI